MIPRVTLEANRQKNVWRANIQYPNGGPRFRAALGITLDTPRDEAEAVLAAWVKTRLPAFLKQRLRKVPQGTQEVKTLTGLADWYVDTVMAGRAGRESTMRRARRILHDFSAFATERGLDTVKDLAAHPDAIDAYAAELLKRLQPSSAKMRLAYLRAALRAAYARHMTDAIPRSWPTFRLPDAEYEAAVNAEDIRDMLRRLQPTQYAAIVTFLAHVGCRPVDAVRLQWAAIVDLDSPAPIAVIRQSKTGQNVAVALAPHAAEVIRQERENGSGSPYVFTKRNGRPFPVQSFINVIRRFGAAYSPKITAKSFRQHVVSTLFNAGVDAAIVRRVTGHRSDALYKYRRLRASAAHEAAAIVAETLK